jgi:hypothetical protein
VDLESRMWFLTEIDSNSISVSSVRWVGEISGTIWRVDSDFVEDSESKFPCKGWKQKFLHPFGEREHRSAEQVGMGVASNTMKVDKRR